MDLAERRLERIKQIIERASREIPTALAADLRFIISEIDATAKGQEDDMLPKGE